MPIRLSEVAEEIQLLQSSNLVSVCGYIHNLTGKIVQITDEVRDLAGDGDLAIARLTGWQKAAAQEARLVLDSPDYLRLPSPHDLDEYRLMQKFAGAQASRAHAQRLLDAITGKGAYRRFKDTAYELGLSDDWQRYRHQAFEKLAAAFLDEHGIAYER